MGCVFCIDLVLSGKLVLDCFVISLKDKLHKLNASFIVQGNIDGV